MVHNTPDNFEGGKIRFSREAWTAITTDKWILDLVLGYKIEFESVPSQDRPPRTINFSDKEKEFLNSEIEKLLDKNVIEPVCVTTDKDFVSNIFLRPKKDGTYRLILNLSVLNQYIEYNHFKMETLQSAVKMMKKNCWYASVDLKDAYYSVNIAHEDRCYLQFYWSGNKYQYTSLPNGLTTGPRIFTKLMKPVFSTLRKMGHANVGYIDDTLLQSETFNECVENVQDTVELFDSLGCTYHPDKSVVIPTQEIAFLGFLLNSVLMIVRATPEKAEEIRRVCANAILKPRMTIRDWAQIVGKLIACDSGVEFTPLHTNLLEKLKDTALKERRGNYDAHMALSAEAITELEWWRDNIVTSFKPVSHGQPNMVITTDSSMLGWGAVVTDSVLYTGGHWDFQEQQHHINYLELEAAFLGLQCFCADSSDIHVRLFLDNMVAISYIENMGGRIRELNYLARDIWDWCIDRNIWCSAAHIPGVENIEADRLSRKLNPDIEWMISHVVFTGISDAYDFQDSSIDLFASRINRQLPGYVSYLPDPEAHAVDAFSLCWSNVNGLMYLFPPFSILDRTVQKVAADEATVVLVAPLWTTQPWFSGILSLIAGPSYLLPPTKVTLTHPACPGRVHPLQKMRLGVFYLSGKPSVVRDFQNQLPRSLWTRGDSRLKNSIGVISTDGCSFVYKGKLIRLDHLLCRF
jgi:hypothetical protein